MLYTLAMLSSFKLCTQQKFYLRVLEFCNRKLSYQINNDIINSKILIQLFNSFNKFNGYNL